MSLPMKNTIKIAVVDDHALFRTGIISLLEEFDDLTVTLEAENGQEFCNLIEQKKPDVVLLDIEMPVMDGIKTTEFLHKNYPDIKIVILTSYNEEALVVYLIEKGAHGFLLKNNEIETVVDSIHAVMETGYFFNDKVSKLMVKKLLNNEKINPHFKRIDLSDREIEIVKLICQEMTNKEIADHLCISNRTVDWHRDNILKKTKAKNAIGIVMYAVKHKLL